MKAIRMACMTLIVILVYSSLCCSSPLKEGLNLLSNPGFEQGMTDWYINDANWHVISGISHSGKSSLQFANSDPTAYPLLAHSIPVQRDGRYRLSAWIKTENIQGSGGASIGLEYYDTNGKYVESGCHPVPLTGTHDWTLVEGESVRVPSNVTRVMLVLYLTKGSAGVAWYDDINVVPFYDFVFRPLITHPNYRNTIFSDQKKRIDLSVAVSGNPLHTLNSLLARLTVQQPKGKSITKVTGIVGESDGVTNFTFPLPKDSVGEYKLSAELVDKHTGTVYAARSSSVQILQQNVDHPKVYIDGQNRCMVDGRPFFPIGFYSWGDPAKSIGYLGKMNGTAFNAIINYTLPYYPLESINSFLDAAQKNAVKAIFSVKDCYEGSTWALTSSGSWKGSFEVVKGMSDTFAHHPSILAWYVNDELSGSYLPEIAKRYEYLRDHDPDHPILQVLYPEQDVESHSSNTDIIVIDHYPVWNQSKSGDSYPKIEKFGVAARRAREACFDSRPVWMVAECSSIDPGLSKRRLAPSYQQIMCESYQALAEGARGLFYFDLYDLLEVDGDTQWNVVRRVGEDFQKIAPIAMGDDVPVKMRVSVDDSRVRAITRIVGHVKYVLAVNSSLDTVDVNFTIPHETTTHYAEIEVSGVRTRSIQITNHNFSDKLSPMDTRIYRLSE